MLTPSVKLMHRPVSDPTTHLVPDGFVFVYLVLHRSVIPSVGGDLMVFLCSGVVW